MPKTMIHLNNSEKYFDNETCNPYLNAAYGSHHIFVKILLINPAARIPQIPNRKYEANINADNKLRNASIIDFHFTCQKRP